MLKKQARRDCFVKVLIFSLFALEDFTHPTHKSWWWSWKLRIYYRFSLNIEIKRSNSTEQLIWTIIVTFLEPSSTLTWQAWNSGNLAEAGSQFQCGHLLYPINNIKGPSLIFEYHLPTLQEVVTWLLRRVNSNNSYPSPSSENNR